MKISPRRPVPQKRIEPAHREPLFLWWMPLAGLALAAAWGVWEAANESDSDAVDRLTAFAGGIVWPGVAIIAVTTFLVWLAWKVDFE